MVRFIGKCGICKATTARDYVEFQSKMTGTGIYRREIKIAGRTVDGVFINASSDFNCGACGAPRWDGKRVEGFKTSHVCDVRCTDAKGFKCACACGGSNHGKAFLCA